MIPSVVVRQMRRQILDYLRTTFNPSDEEFARQLFEFLDGPSGLFRGPYLDIRLPFRRAPADAALPLDVLPPFRLFAHQVEAFGRLSSRGERIPQCTLITTGTGSGKTECFLYPILDHCLRHAETPGIKAILLYPMNALANDQARRLARLLWDDQRLRGRVSGGLYVGGHGNQGSADRDHLVDKREILRDSPPDILLTNYRMLDFLLLRPEDKKLWRNNGPDTMRYLVLDELHTYDGAQGTDVACLIRRLKARLQIHPGRLCCVGTSATLGARSRDEAARALTDFAGKIFQEAFPPESVVTEERLGPRETLGDQADVERFPTSGDGEALGPESYAEPSAWLAAQAKLWLGEDGASLDPVALGRRLERHIFLRQILQTLEGQVQSLPELEMRLARIEPLFARLDNNLRPIALQSFLGLLSQARRSAQTDEDPDRLEPFLVLQLHLWTRELRRLLRRIGPPADDPAHPPALFAWANEEPARPGAPGGSHWLPLAWCRECGAFGVGACKREGDLRLQSAPQVVGEAWLQRSPSARYLSFGSAPEGEGQEYLCPGCLRLSLEQICACRPGQTTAGIPVRISREVSDPHGANPPRFLARCPECGKPRSLSLLGARAPSLLSVAISHLYETDYNDDRKLLAFTDSVQDASHRAGFFGARTYRFNLRRAIQVLVENEPDDIPLPAMPDRLLGFWGARADHRTMVAALWPSDLQEADTYQRFLSEGGAEPPRQLLEDLRARLSWEVVQEYGLGVKAGRSLERTACSTVGFDPSALDRACEALDLDLKERGTLASRPADQITREDLRRWCLGLLDRLRVQGGIDHPFLRPYMQQGGVRYLLSRARQPLLSPFGPESIFPTFLTDRLPADGSAEPLFDSAFSRPNRPAWYRDWAARALGLDRRDEGINDLHRLALRRLADTGLLRAYDLKRDGTVWGICPEALSVTRRLVELMCPLCRHRSAVPEREASFLLGRRCAHYRCPGALDRPTSHPGPYYARFYRSGRLLRIFPREHTGLLGRRQREILEERFKQGDAPDAPNLIVCTPTLEMGIDVGDLSAVMLCSVPPTTAHFLQRVGRAGRRTGNALCFTMALSRPHDLYFQAEPLEMMAGPVLPPGCFLDAPEMLKRQLVAHAMDSWAREETVALRIPAQASAVLTESGGRVFPGRFLDFYGRERGRLLASFLDLFGASLSPANRQRLEEFASGEDVPEATLKAFRDLQQERADLHTLQRRARGRLQEIERNPESSDHPEEERVELEESRRVLRRLVEELGHKYPLNVLADAGVLPNYAFPEPGVTLDSVVREEGARGRRRYRAYEFVRPASSAIREFAPFNIFYADGRRVRIDEIDLGPRARPLTEDWRLCAECAHMERGVDGDKTAASCPRCGDPGWADAGQVRTLVHFRRARSLASGLEAASADGADNREEEHYQLLDLIDVGPEHSHGARVIESLPFGIELLKNLSLREVNFGLLARSGPTAFQVAGQAVQATGFEVCVLCGRVRRAGHEFQHAAWCRTRRPGAAESFRTIHLYRQIRSEALRILLPASEVDYERRQASFKAALELGFRRHFQGSPGHLQIRFQQEPTADGRGHRRFLIVFDAVPGGTGYLAELWQGESFLKVLDGALRALLVCPCRSDPQKDGCYRCLYAYQEQYSLSLISSRTAEEMLSAILSRREEWRQAGTLSQVPLHNRLESELEIRFLRALRTRIEREPGACWSQTIQAGEERYELRLPARNAEVVWRIRAQVDLGPAEGVVPPCRPDFLFIPQAGMEEDRERLPLAVFCDGFAYHVCPGEPQGVMADDLRKRLGLLRSDRYRIWTVTWKDVEDFERAEPGSPAGTLFAEIDLPRLGQVLHRLAGPKTPPVGREHLLLPNPRAGNHGSMDMLLDYLRSPSSEGWRHLAAAYLLAWTAGRPSLEVALADRLEEELEELPQRLDVGLAPAGAAITPPAVCSRLHAHGWFAALTRYRTAGLAENPTEEVRCLLRLFDEAEGRAAPDFEDSWRSFYQAWNLLQFHGRLSVVSSETLPVVYSTTPESVTEDGQELLRAAEASPDRAPGVPGLIRNMPEAALSAEWRRLWELSTAASRPLLQRTAEAGLPVPEFDLELRGKAGGCGPQAELAWPGLKLAVLAERQAEDASAFVAEGWKVWIHPFDPADLLVVLQERSEENR